MLGTTVVVPGVTVSAGWGVNVPFKFVMSVDPSGAFVTPRGGVTTGLVVAEPNVPAIAGGLAAGGKVGESLGANEGPTLGTTSIGRVAPPTPVDTVGFTAADAEVASPACPAEAAGVPMTGCSNVPPTAGGGLITGGLFGAPGPRGIGVNAGVVGVTLGTVGVTLGTVGVTAGAVGAATLGVPETAAGPPEDA